KPCLRHHIKLCTAPCAGRISEKDYDTRISRIRQILSGKAHGLVQQMEKEMSAFSRLQDFEKAMELRDQIAAVKYLSERQIVERQKKYDEDIINYLVRDSTVFLMIFNISKGMLVNKREFEFDTTPDFLQEFVVQYYAENDIPKELIIPDKLDASVASYLSGIAKRKVGIIVPERGEKKALLDLVMRNIDVTFFGDETKLVALRDCLKLQDIPRVIECFDISHLSGTSTVGSMVQFRSARPDKSNYRRFRIRTVKHIDDARSIAEVVQRRYRRLKDENAALPDLVIIDGGKAQLNFALAEISKLDLRIPVIALAKRFEEVYLPGLSFPVRPEGKALLFLKEVRNEAHRFAIKYNRLLRKKSLLNK
ncbi:MAG: excinuclease ABC subunit UvrC, partial [Candidatus Woesearchaeota archaeon]